MKHKITIVLLFLLSYTLYSQQIKGLILDKDRQSIPYAEVLLYNNTGAKLIKGTITNENGEFLIDNLKLEESYTIKISFLGYKQKKIVNILVKKDINLGEIIILEDRTTLDEVEITARKPLIKIESDKLVFNVGVSISNEGLNGLELLRKTPGVIINMNNQILLRGKIGTLVYIDDNTTYLSGYQLTRFLESLNTNDIESLEVISNPSSKYDAEGNAGIINIRLKKNKYYGTNGSFNTGFRYGKKPKHNVGINLNKRTEKLNIFGGLTAKYQLNVSNLEVQRKFNNYDSTDRLSETNTENHPLNLSLGADYVLNSKSFLGIKTRLNTNYLTDKSNINSRTAIVNFQNTPINSVLLAETEDLDNLLNANLNLHYAFKDTIGNNWTIDLNKGYYSFSQQRDQPNLYYNNDLTNLLDDNSIESNSHSIINFHTLQSDYSKKINNFFLSSFQAGVKYSKVHTNNELNFYNVIVNNSIENLEKSNDFSYNEEIIAGYTSIKGSLNELVKYKIGFRTEQTVSIGDLRRRLGQVSTEEDYKKRNYIDFFPSTSLTYSINDSNILNLSYSRRITRPTYKNLNPFEWREDALTILRGNPFLKPTYADNIELNYVLNNTTSIAFSYGNSTDIISQIRLEPDTLNANIFFPENIGNKTVYSLSIASPIKIERWWNIYATSTFFTSKLKPTIEENEYNSFRTSHLFNYNINIENTFNINEFLSLQVSGYYGKESDGIWIQEPVYFLNLGIKKVFWDSKASLKLSFNDVFGTQGYRGRNDVGERIKFSYSYVGEFQTIGLFFAYKFGSSKVKAATSRKRGDEELSNRL